MATTTFHRHPVEPGAGAIRTALDHVWPTLRWISSRWQVGLALTDETSVAFAEALPQNSQLRSVTLNVNRRRLARKTG